MTKAQEARARYEAMQGVSKLSKSELLEERAKRLGERFGLEIKAGEWQHAAAPPNSDTVLRIDKPIRMRVRRTCHKCSTGFGAAKECPGCSHVRCTKCARYPPKRTEAEVIASRERRAALMKANKENQAIVPDYDFENYNDREFVLKKPSKTGGQDLIYKKPRQRVRRTCHECQALFMAHSKKCENCSHIRCTDCPRDPPKKDKYPFGYPGDAFGPSSVPRYECERCHSLYPADAENGIKCTQCGREKTDESPRARPRKVEPEPDPEILKRIEARMAALSVGSTAGETKKEGITT
ncbi:hypothetical protein ACRE_004370 [Hapsidospora chrysogenum ATCC 11550]|uniref:Uncharacterized protein n=1 Tax=Hapsidospora chrysogenum (strain ATCC 11550 / CBS 779.69 / DSM 880 / IAM 14645 / JCM 23072 / IMI 49137) TaxID=857340 RepID=A0A086TH32_HAPC1|nr:hypothetical protein ACRE_004370 [Hapsidospora chrysogenum ATCC 11550]